MVTTHLLFQPARWPGQVVEEELEVLGRCSAVRDERLGRLEAACEQPRVADGTRSWQIVLVEDDRGAAPVLRKIGVVAKGEGLRVTTDGQRIETERLCRVRGVRPPGGNGEMQTVTRHR